MADQLRHDLLTPHPVGPFVEDLSRGHGSEISAIIFYGSCLFAETQTESSVPDFYVLVADPRRYHRSLWHALLNAVLPPNVYHGLLAANGGQRARHYKYCVLTTSQFRRETSPFAHDIHHLGRFSKRFALIYSRDEATTRVVVQGALTAMLTLVPHSLALLPETFTLDEFLWQQLGLSYLGEHRVVEPSKVWRLIQGARDYYQTIYSGVLRLSYQLNATPLQVGECLYRQTGGDPRRQRRHTQLFLDRSRRRGMLRWPKYIFTVDNWLAYVLGKLERHHGIRVELTPLQQRFPLLFGWPIYLRFRRLGIVR